MTSSDERILIVPNADATISWLLNTSDCLSRLGTSLVHPNKLLKISKAEAKAHLLVWKDEVKKRTLEVTQILKNANWSDFNKDNKEIPERSLINTKQSFDIEKEFDWRSYLNNNTKHNFYTPRQGSDYISEEHKDISGILVKKYWNLVRIQISILELQLQSQDKEESLTSSSLRRKSLTLDKLANRDTTDQVKLQTPLNCQEKSDLLIEYPEIIMDKKEKHYLRSELNFHSVDISPRDDGYCSKFGESTTEEACSFSDIYSLDVDNGLQTENIQERSRSYLNERRVAHRASTKKIHGNLTTKAAYPKIDSDGWSEVYSLVEVFCNNAVSLLSWLDELEEIEELNGRTDLESQATRKHTVIRHIVRLYFEVIEDGASLLRNIPSEKATLLTVIHRIDDQCRKLGVSVGNDLASLSSIEPLKSNLDHKSEMISTKLQKCLSGFLPTLGLLPKNSDPDILSPSESVSLFLRNRPIPATSSTPRLEDTDYLYNKQSFNNRNHEFHSRKLAEENLSFSETLSPLKEKSRSSCLLDHELTYDCPIDKFGWMKSCQYSQSRTSDISPYRIEKKIVHEIDAKQRAGLSHKNPPLSCDFKYPTNKSFLRCIRTQEPGSLFHQTNDINLLKRDPSYCKIQKSFLFQQNDESDYNYELLCDFFPSNWRWHNFLEDYDLLYNWLERMEILINQTESRRLSLMEKETNILKYLSEFDEKITKKDQLKSEAHAVEYVYPELKDDVQIMLLDMNELWNDLYLRLTYYLSEFNCTDISSIYEKTYLDSECSRKPDSSDLFFEPKCKLSKNDRSTNYDDCYDNSSRHLISSSFLQKPRKAGTRYQQTPKTSFQKTLEVANVQDITPSTSTDLNQDGFAYNTLLFMTPYELSVSIKNFHHWLKGLEEDVYYDQSVNIGWNPKRVKERLRSNKDYSINLRGKTFTLDEIKHATAKLLKVPCKEVSEFCLMWASWMLEQRYYNLILYTTDMECILERRIEILEKDHEKISHPLDGAWSDQGEKMKPSTETINEDYNILWSN